MCSLEFKFFILFTKYKNMFEMLVNIMPTFHHLGQHNTNNHYQLRVKHKGFKVCLNGYHKDEWELMMSGIRFNTILK